MVSSKLSKYKSLSYLKHLQWILDFLLATCFLSGRTINILTECFANVVVATSSPYNMKHSLITFVFLDILLVLLIFLQFERIKYLPIGNSKNKISHQIPKEKGYANVSKTRVAKHKKVPYRVNEKRRLNDLLARYIEKEHSAKDTWIHEPVQMRNSSVIIYARINKSGSTTLTSKTLTRKGKQEDNLLFVLVFPPKVIRHLYIFFLF